MRRDDFGGELIKGHLDMLLLSVLEHGALHGYAIIEQLHASSSGMFRLPEGTIYPALHRLERAGYVVSEWSRHEGRRRRDYTLTTAGRETLAVRRDEWASFSSAVNGVMNSPVMGNAT